MLEPCDVFAIACFVAVVFVCVQCSKSKPKTDDVKFFEFVPEDGVLKRKEIK